MPLTLPKARCEVTVIDLTVYDSRDFHTVPSKRLPVHTYPGDQEKRKMTRTRRAAAGDLIRQVDVERLINIILKDDLRDSIWVLHGLIEMDRTHVVTVDTAPFDNLSEDIKIAIRTSKLYVFSYNYMTNLSGIRALCEEASNALIALVALAVLNLPNLTPQHLIGHNFIAPFQTV